MSSAWCERQPDGTLLVAPRYGVVQPAPVVPAEVTTPVGKTPPNRKRITLALDMSGMYGPEVDEALGVPEPEVDQWEAGVTTPTTDEVRRLATLTGFPVTFFYQADPPELQGPMFMCGARGYRSIGHTTKATLEEAERFAYEMLRKTHAEEWKFLLKQGFLHARDQENESRRR